MANPIDTTFSFIPEVTAGTTPSTTPAWKPLEYTSGDFQLNSKMVTSDALKASRASAGTRKVFAEVGGNIKAHFRRDTTIDILLQSALSGTFTSNVLKGGSTDSTLSCEKYMKDASNMYWRYNGLMVSKFGVSVGADTNAEASFEFTGMGRTTGSSIITGATYTAATQGPTFTGVDVGTITIGSYTAVYTNLELSVEQNRDALSGLGSINAIGVGTAGPRMIKLSVKAFRKDLTGETLFIPDTPVAVTVNFGAGTGNQYSVVLPAAVASIPVDETSGGSALLSFDLYAQYDTTTATDISITKN